MRINHVAQEPTLSPAPAFKASFVTLSKRNLGEEIAVNVVDKFNKSILPKIKSTQIQEAEEIIRNSRPGKVIQKAKDFQENVNFFTLAAGSGSRFRELAQTVGNFNKISLPFKVDSNTDIHMLDFALAMGKYFIQDGGVKKIVASQPSGSFGDIVQHYLSGNPVKDTVVCCGDNVFGDNASSMMEFMTSMINNPQKHVALVGVARKPEEVANRFGVLVAKGDLNGETLSLHGFDEKPPLEVAKTLTVNGKNIANTGLFYVSKEAMEKLLDEIKHGTNNIKKNENEPYDFALAVKYIHSRLHDWFGIAPSEGADVKVVKQWEDVGEPAALYSFADEVKKGSFIANFPKELAQKIKAAFSNRVHLDAEHPHILFTDSTKVSAEKITDAKKVEGVHIVV